MTGRSLSYFYQHKVHYIGCIVIAQHTMLTILLFYNSGLYAY